MFPIRVKKVDKTSWVQASFRASDYSLLYELCSMLRSVLHVSHVVLKDEGPDLLSVCTLNLNWKVWSQLTLLRRMHMCLLRRWVFKWNIQMRFFLRFVVTLYYTVCAKACYFVPVVTVIIPGARSYQNEPITAVGGWLRALSVVP